MCHTCRHQSTSTAVVARRDFAWLGPFRSHAPNGRHILSNDLEELPQKDRLLTWRKNGKALDGVHTDNPALTILAALPKSDLLILL